MRNKKGLNNILSTNRKKLYIVLSIVMISILTLTVVYAALSTTLNITGNAEVTAASWDIYLDNVQLNNRSATSNIPTISNKTTASFSTTLSKPGDFYEFTVDAVNNGSIDAMIDSVTKTPELTDTQKKYLNYIVEYQNGEAITTKQLVSKNSFVRLKVKVEFRKDISASDLPKQSETLNLSFKVNYVQSDETNVKVENNGKWPKVLSGDLNTIGSEIAIGDEHFYIISSDEDSVIMLSKYNLEVGNTCTSTTSCTPIENPSGIQDSTMIGWNESITLYQGTTPFSSDKQKGENYSDYNGSLVERYVSNYKSYLISLGVNLVDARLITKQEIIDLGCIKERDFCSSETPSWVYATSYWSMTSVDDTVLWYVATSSRFDDALYVYKMVGVRPVIIISKTEF